MSAWQNPEFSLMLDVRQTASDTIDGSLMIICGDAKDSIVNYFKTRRYLVVRNAQVRVAIQRFLEVQIPQTGEVGGHCLLYITFSSTSALLDLIAYLKVRPTQPESDASHASLQSLHVPLFFLEA
jgi:hypothetical protein